MLSAPALPIAAEHMHVVASALDQSDNILLVLERLGDARLRLVGMNDAFARVTGYAPAELVGGMFPGLLGVPAEDKNAAGVAAAARRYEPHRAELLCRRADARTFWFGLHLMPTGGDTFVVLGRDITERLRETQQQHAVQALLAKVFLVVNAAVAVVGGDGRVLMSNPAMSRMLGYPADAIAGRPSLDFVSPESRDTVIQARTRQTADGQPYAIKVGMLARSGERVAALLSSAAIEHSDQQRLRIVTLTPVGEAETVEPPAPPPPVQSFTVAGKIRLVGLEAVKDALGDRWEAVAEKARQTAEHVVRKRLGPNDSFSRTDDDGILICFAGLNEEEASFRAAMIGRDIRQRLIGMNEDPAAAQVTAIATKAPNAADGGLPAARILDQLFNARLSEIEQKARGTLADALKEATCVLEQVLPRAGAAVAQYAAISRGTEQRVLTAMTALPASEVGEFDLDLLRLRVVSQHVAEATGGAKNPVLMEVSFELFDLRPRTERFLEFCRKMSAPLRERLVFLLCDRPPGIQEARLRENIQRLRPFCREIGFRVSELELPPVAAAPPAMTTVAIGYEDLGDTSVAVEEALFAFMAPLHAKRGRLLVRDVPTQEAAQMLRELGVDLIAFAAS